MTLKRELMSATNETVAALVDRLVEASAREDEELDYKETLTVQTEAQKLEFARDVSSFANCRGGHLIFGVREKRVDGETTGEPEAAVGVTINPDKVERQLLDLLDVHVQPRAPGVRVRIGRLQTGHVVVVSVPRSWAAPHRVSDGRYSVRQGARNRMFDVQELRTAFVGGEESAMRIRRFQQQRLARLVAGDTPVPVTAATFLMLHVIPVAGFEGRFVADLDWVAKNATKLAPSSDMLRYWATRFNIDGFVGAVRPNSSPALQYAQVFRSGAIEYVDTYAFQPAKPEGSHVEVRVLRAVRAHANVLDALGAPPPYAVLSAIHGVEGRELSNAASHRPEFEEPTKFDRDTIVLPDVMITNEARPLEDVLKPMFDVLWQAAGWPRSLGYDSDGRFDAKRHRD